MANGIITLSSTRAVLEGRIVWESSANGTVANSSYVAGHLQVRRNDGYTTQGTWNGAMNIGGTVKSFSVHSTIGSSWITVLDLGVTVSHSSNGSGTCYIEGYCNGPSGTSMSGHSVSGKQTVTLDTIPRQATITSAPNFNDEGNPTINYSNTAGNSVTTLQACISITGESADIAYRDISKTGSSYTFNLTEAERKLLRRATTGNSRTVTFYVRTVIGGVTYWSSLARTFSIVNGNPTFTASQITYADTSTAVTAITGNNQHIVQNQSNLKVTIGSATANKESSISKYDITVNGVTKTVTASGTVDFGKVNSSANITVSVKVTDSRGNTVTSSKTITVLAWSSPVFTASLERLNNYEDETYLTVDASISSVNSKNTMKISYQYKESGGNYGNAVSIANRTQYTISCDKNKAYIFSITVEDAFGRTTTEFALSKGKFPLFIDTQKNAVGINEFPAEDEALRVSGGVAHFEDGIKINNRIVADSVIEQGETNGWTYRKWASGIAECWKSGVSGTINPSKMSQHSLYYYTPLTMSYPFDFATPPVAIVDGGSPNAINSIRVSNVTTYDLSFWVLCLENPDVDLTIEYQIYVKGKI